jgi:DNA-binding beta-propeller fold protein YncE
MAGVSLLTASAYSGEIPSTTRLAISKDSGAIGFDDLGFSSALRKVIVPAAQTGKLVLIEPGSNKLDEISGFSSRSGGDGGGHAEGVTSADVGRGAIFTADRSEKTLQVVDPSTNTIIAKSKLGSGPDYVRFVTPTDEVWVTEPHKSQIEIFSLPKHGFPEPVHAAVIKIANGPESLVIDAARGRAFVNLWTDATLAIDLHSRAVVARWRNGCDGSRGLALDPVRGFLFVGCKKGKLEVLSLKDGHHLGEVSAGDGVDIIAYAPSLHHAYLPGAASATMAVVGISSSGKADVLATVPTAKGSHCVTVDDINNAYICDPQNGQLLIFHDSIPATSK